MSRWIRTTKDPAWAALFTGYEKSAYRLEGQQTYSNDAEDAAVARFRAGKPHGLTFDWSIPKLRAQVAAGRTQTTVRVVVEPPTDYTRFELAVYPEFAAAGEIIKIVSVRGEQWPQNVPRHDYWLLDDHDVWRMHYHDNYRFAGAELIEDEDEIAMYREGRDAALAQSVPLGEYLAART